MSLSPLNIHCVDKTAGFITGERSSNGQNKNQPGSALRAAKRASSESDCQSGEKSRVASRARVAENAVRNCFIETVRIGDI